MAGWDPRAVIHLSPVTANCLCLVPVGFEPKWVCVGAGRQRQGLTGPLVTPFHPPLTACGPGVWGPQCDKPCSCGNSSSCDPKTGECSCPAGLQPPRCLRPCSPGRYGPACQFNCHCHGAPCDPQTGACFCPPDRAGPRCGMGDTHTRIHRHVRGLRRGPKCGEGAERPRS